MSQCGSGDDQTCPQFELHRQKLLEDLDEKDVLEILKNPNPQLALRRFYYAPPQRGTL